MTDRELLEKAARAYWGDEIDNECSIRWLEEDQAIGFTHGDNQDHNGEDRELVWNPLTDDGDALRLAVKMRFEISLSHDGRDRVFAEVKGRICCGEDSSVDPYAATRRAIVRAAAQMDKDGV